MRFRSALDEARHHWNASAAEHPDRNAFGRLRQFVRHFGESHARQFDDVRFGSRDLKRRSLSRSAFGLFEKDIFIPHCSPATVDSIRRQFFYNYLKDQEFSELYAEAQAESSQVAAKILKNVSIQTLADNDEDLVRWARTHLRQRPYGGRLDPGIKGGLSILTYIEREDLGLSSAQKSKLILTISVFVGLEASSRGWNATEYVSEKLMNTDRPTALEAGLYKVILGRFGNLFRAARDDVDLDYVEELSSFLLQAVGSEKERLPSEVTALLLVTILQILLSALRITSSRGSDERRQETYDRAMRVFATYENYSEFFVSLYGRNGFETVSPGQRFDLVLAWAGIKGFGAPEEMRQAVDGIEQAWQRFYDLGSPSNLVHATLRETARMLFWLHHREWAAIAFDELSLWFQRNGGGEYDDYYGRLYRETADISLGEYCYEGREREWGEAGRAKLPKYAIRGMVRMIRKWRQG